MIGSAAEKNLVRKPLLQQENAGATAHLIVSKWRALSTLIEGCGWRNSRGREEMVRVRGGVFPSSYSADFPYCHYHSLRSSLLGFSDTSVLQ